MQPVKVHSRLRMTAIKSGCRTQETIHFPRRQPTSFCRRRWPITPKALAYYAEGVGFIRRRRQLITPKASAYYAEGVSYYTEGVSLLHRRRWLVRRRRWLISAQGWSAATTLDS